MSIHPEQRLSTHQFRRVIQALDSAGYASEDIQWSESITPPVDPDVFAAEAIFVICNSGMRNTIAVRIYRRVMDALREGRPVHSIFGHAGKGAAIELIWKERANLLEQYQACGCDVERLNFCARLPFIGQVTKYHLAKNFGIDVAKPDLHLVRMARRGSESVDQMCGRLAKETGYRVATVDLLIWRACATGVINSRTGEVNA